MSKAIRLLLCAALAALSCARLRADGPAASGPGDAPVRIPRIAPSPVLQANLGQFSDADYASAVEALFARYESGTHRRLVPGRKGRVGLKIYTDSGPGMATPVPLVKAVIATESDYRADVVSSAGAAGLMQLMPATARQYGVGNRFDVGENLRAGIAHLAYLLRRYDGDSDRALAAYNAGEAAVDRCRCIPDIPETVAYVGHVRALLAASRTTPSRADMASQPSHRRPGP